MLSDPQRQKYLEQLFELVSIPSISALPEHKVDMAKAIDWLKNYLTSLGVPAKKIELLYAKGLSSKTSHPVLYAEKIDNPDNPTVIIYGHYDVQPVDPLDQWLSDPFKPEVREQKIFARGATDDKGQLFTHLAALDILKEEWGQQWPVNFKFLFEGEEEMGGENIAALLAEYQGTSKFAADVCLISDSSFHSAGQPSIEYGLRGLTYMQINVRLADADMHSGVYGGGVLNPINALAHLISKLYDVQTGNILIPGFYDDVLDVSPEERQKLGELPFDEVQWLQEASNAKAAFGEPGYSIIERTTARPTLEVNGIWGGFQGEGAKTIIPASAHAKVSMRLVANQEPLKIAELFTNFLREIAPGSVDMEVKLLHVGDGMLINLDGPYLQKAEQALQQVFGKAPLYTRTGGSIPVAAQIKKFAGVDPLLVGYGLPDDRLHSPNEKLDLNQFYGGIECNLLLYKSIGQ